MRYFRHPGIPGTDYCRGVDRNNNPIGCGRMFSYHGWIDTLEGGHTVCPGDWIIKGVVGEFYPCKPDVFAATYEPFSPSPAHKERLDRRQISHAIVTFDHDREYFRFAIVDTWRAGKRRKDAPKDRRLGERRSQFVHSSHRMNCPSLTNSYIPCNCNRRTAEDRRKG